LDFIYGLDLKYSYFYSYTNNKYEEYPLMDVERMEYNHAPGANIVLGFNYLINESIIFGIELLPGGSYAMGKRTETYSGDTERDVDFDKTHLSFGLSSSSAILSLAYRFH